MFCWRSRWKGSEANPALNTGRAKLKGRTSTNKMAEASGVELEPFSRRERQREPRSEILSERSESKDLVEENGGSEWGSNPPVTPLDATRRF